MLNKHKILSILFLTVFLSAFGSGIYISISNALPDLAHFSKFKELKNNTEKGTTSQDFIFEENETKSETELEFDLWSVLLPYFVSFSNILYTTDNFLELNTIIQNKCAPIFISVRNIRI